MSNPEPSILSRAAAAGLSIIVSADAHWPVNVAVHFGEALQVLHEAGFTNLVVPSAGEWSSIPLPSPG
jgi:hypothetical protein